eukprot:4634054-Amphidinium_carterae.5
MFIIVSPDTVDEVREPDEIDSARIVTSAALSPVPVATPCVVSIGTGIGAVDDVGRLSGGDTGLAAVDGLGIVCSTVALSRERLL